MNHRWSIVMVFVALAAPAWAQAPPQASDTPAAALSTADERQASRIAWDLTARGSFVVVAGRLDAEGAEVVVASGPDRCLLRLAPSLAQPQQTWELVGETCRPAADPSRLNVEQGSPLPPDQAQRLLSAKWFAYRTVAARVVTTRSLSSHEGGQAIVVTADGERSCTTELLAVRAADGAARWQLDGHRCDQAGRLPIQEHAAGLP